MAQWNLFYTDEAIDDLNNLDHKLKKRVKSKLNWLTENFDEITPESLGGRWSGFFKLRIGDWRVIYDIDWKDGNLLIIAIGRRDKVYK